MEKNEQLTSVNTWTIANRNFIVPPRSGDIKYLDNKILKVPMR